MEVPVERRRPPSLPLICIVFPAYSSFSVLRGTPHRLFLLLFQKAKLLRNFNYDAREKKVKKRKAMMNLDMLICVGGIWEPCEGNMPAASTGAAPRLPFR